MTAAPFDRAALSQLVHGYAARVDAREFDRVAALFVPDGVLVAPEPPASLAPSREHVGRTEIQQALTALDGFLKTFHALVGEDYRAGDEPGQVFGHVACIAHHVTAARSGGFIDITWMLRYDDEYRRFGDGYSFVRREIHIQTIAVGEIKQVAGVTPP